MRSPIRSRNRHARIPLTITLDSASFDFIEASASRRQFRSVDEFFEAALAIYKNHLEALNAYVEIQEARGLSMDEIMRTARPEIVFTRRRSRKRK
jgi:hypothetical protein